MTGFELRTSGMGSLGPPISHRWCNHYHSGASFTWIKKDIDCSLPVNDQQLR